MIVQSSPETRQQLWHKQHSFSSPCLTPSRFFQQAAISPSANLACFPFLSGPEFIPVRITLSLTDSAPVSHPSSSPHPLSYSGSSPVVLSSFVTSPAPCMLHISSPIDSRSLYLQQSNSPVCSSASSRLSAFTSVTPLLSPHQSYCSHLHREDVQF